MTPAEKLYAMCQLLLHGYSSEEAQRIVEEIEEKIEKDSL
jgi:hypothetical protein